MKMSISVVPTVPRVIRPIGAILVDAGRLSREDVERILNAQKQRGLKFGELAIQMGLLTADDVQYALAEQFSFPYLNPGSEGRQISRELEAAFEPYSPAAERLRSVRSQLLLRWYNKGERRQVLSVVGTQRREGRTYLAANLAVVFAQLGERTLLIDANFRSPRLHDLFSLQNRSGLSTLLSGRSGHDAIVHITELAGLFVLPSGPVPPNPLELLGQPAFTDLLMHARNSFDLVLIDTPGASEGDDALMVTVQAGAALAVARNGHTRVNALRGLVEGLGQVGVEVVGTVLNEVPRRKKAEG